MKSPAIGASHSIVTRKVLENFTTQIYDEKFIDGNRLSVKSFERDRFFTFSNLIMFMLQKSNGSYKKELNSFFDHLGISPDAFPSASSFCQARCKISEKVFIELNQNAVETFYRHGDFKTWKGHPVLSIDGSTLQLPKHETIKKEFGVHGFGPKADREQSLARISYLYDSLNGLVINGEMRSYATSEAEMAWDHLKFLKKDDVVVFDRYYPSKQLMSALKKMGVHFCFKMKTDWWSEVKAFQETSSDDEKVCFELPAKYKQWAEENEMPEKFFCRLIKNKNKSGEIEILLTSLLSKERYSHADICDLYRKRWEVEEGIKLIKARLDVEEFSGIKSLVVKQDFYCKTLLLTLNAIMCNQIMPSKEVIQDRVIKVNKTLGLSTTKKLFLKLSMDTEIPDLIAYFTKTISGQFVRSRKGQSTPRNKICHQKFKPNYKTA